MNVPTNVTRAAGDVHALGNPHFMSDPIIAKAVAQHIAQSFAALDPEKLRRALECVVKRAPSLLVISHR